jgi:hypothetical protein
MGEAADVRTERLHQVGEDAAELDRRELVRIAEQPEAGAGREGVEELAHHREVGHRGFVDDDEAPGQRVVVVVANSVRPHRVPSIRLPSRKGTTSASARHLADSTLVARRLGTVGSVLGAHDSIGRFKTRCRRLSSIRCRPPESDK